MSNTILRPVPLSAGTPGGLTAVDDAAPCEAPALGVSRLVVGAAASLAAAEECTPDATTVSCRWFVEAIAPTSVAGINPTPARIATAVTTVEPPAATMRR
jgi:hypothetical protein